MTLTKIKAATGAEKVFQKIAAENGTTADEVKQEISSAIAMAMSNTENKADSIWSTMPRKGEVPTPEEVILWAVTKIQEG